MSEFELSTNVISRVINELGRAEKFIRIAMFQIHNEDVFKTISKKLEEGVDVEVFTLPYDSINDNVQTEVIQCFKKIEKQGAILHFCKWNVGDPERTTTASGRWYSFHGKFIVTEKCAISLSANFTKNKELDAILIYKEIEKIEEFYKSFDELIEMFVLKHGCREGKIYERIIASQVIKDTSIFELPSTIKTKDHENNWIQHYPSSFCPDKVEISDKLYIIPFEARGRNILMDLISEAECFVYISTESFTDKEFPTFLCGQSLRRNIELKILTGIKSKDFQDRLNSTFKKMLASDIEIHYTEYDLHAKLIITDKHLVVSSVNLNKINLGFNKTKKYWRENTETLTISTDKELIRTAKEQYLNIFQNSIDVRSKLEEKAELEIKNALELFRDKQSDSRVNLRLNKKAKEMLSKRIVEKQIEVERTTYSIAKIVNSIMKIYNKKKTDDIVIYALILHSLLEKNLTFTQLDQSLKSLNITINLNPLLTYLVSKNLVDKEGDLYKINKNNLQKSMCGGKKDGV